MGSVHNMFGSINTVVVRSADGGPIRGGGGGGALSPASSGPGSPAGASGGGSAFASGGGLSGGSGGGGGGAAPPARALRAIPSVVKDYNGQFVGDGFVLEHVVRGETVGEVLARAHHHAPEMLKAVSMRGSGRGVGEGGQRAQTGVGRGLETRPARHAQRRSSCCPPCPPLALPPCPRVLTKALSASKSPLLPRKRDATQVKRAADAAVAGGRLDAAAGARLVEAYSGRLQGYTYMEAP